MQESQASAAINADQNAAFTEVVERIRSGNCILFLGAGVHAPPPGYLPIKYAPDNRPLLGGDLAEVLARECNFIEKFPDDSVRNLQRVSLCYETSAGKGRQSLISSLDQHLRKDKKPSPALMMLSRLPFKIIVTTNYDTLLETALIKADKQPEVFVYDPDPVNATADMNEDPTEQRPLLFKMHGDLSQRDRDTIVITDEDYIRFVQRMSDKDQLHPVPQTIRYRMLKWSTIFIGYSLQDYNLRLLFRALRWRVDPANIPPSFSLDKKPDPLLIKVYQDERKFITFVTLDLWTFIPRLYTEVTGKEWPDV